MTDDYAIEGEDAGYVPCGEQAAVLVVEEEGAISGRDTGRVAVGQSASALPAGEREAIVGSGVGFVPGPCCECNVLPGSTGLLDAGDGIPGGVHNEVQASAGTLEDTFARVIPYNDDFFGPRLPLTVQLGLAETGQQWWHFTSYGTQAPPASQNTIELDGSTWVLHVRGSSGVSSSASMNLAAPGNWPDLVEYEDWDFGWTLSDGSFELLWDWQFTTYGTLITRQTQFGAGVVGRLSDGSAGGAGATYRIRRSTDQTQIFGASGTTEVPPLLTNTYYRMRLVVDHAECMTRVKVWPRADSEPDAWDHEESIVGYIMPNNRFSLSMFSHQPTNDLSTDYMKLTPSTETQCPTTVVEDSVQQLGPRQYQLKNSYAPGTIVAFVERTGYALTKRQFGQLADNIVEDDPVAGIFSFAASITHSPAYNPTITTGTNITATYIVPPA